MTFIGTATTHTNAVDVANLTVTFSNGAFTNTTTASNVANYTNALGAIDFRDVTLTYSTGSFTESTALDGSVGGTVTVTLAGDTFTQSTGTFTSGNQFTPANVPANLTMVVTVTSSTTAVISLTGSAIAHANANDVTNATIAFNNTAFTATPAANITGSTKSDFLIDFGDAIIAYTGAGFVETSTNSGAVTGSIVATLTSGGPTFKLGGSLAVGTDVTFTNIPAGLTGAVAVTGADLVATLTLTGNATTHTNAVDVADILFTFADSAFTGGLLAANVSGGV
jgi:hypothetical protein